MIRLTNLFFIVLIFPSLALAQMPEKDSTLAADYFQKIDPLVQSGSYKEALDLTANALITYDSIGEKSPYYESTLNQGMGVIYHRLGMFEQAEAFYKKSIAVQTKFLGIERVNLANYLTLGALQADIGKPDESLNILHTALALMDSTQTVNPALRAKFLNNIGNAYSIKGNYVRSEDFYQQSLALRREIFGQEDANLISSYVNLGSLLTQKGDFRKAKDYSNKALELILMHYDENYPDISTIYDNLSLIAFYVADYELALDYSNKSEKIILHNYGSDFVTLGRVYSNLGNTYDKTKQFDPALTSFEKALKIWEKTFGEGPNYFKAATLNSIGHSYIQQKKYREAQNYVQQSLAIHQQVFGPKHPFVSRSYAMLGSLALFENQPEKALSLYEKASDAAYYQSSSNSTQIIPSVELLDALIFQGIANNELYLKHNDPAYLQKGASFFTKANQLKISLKNQLSDYESKQQLLAGANLLTEHALTNLWHSYQLEPQMAILEQAIEYAEYGKNMLLYEALQEVDALSSSNIPDSLLNKENDLKVNITYLQRQLSELLGFGLPSTDSTIIDLNSKLFQFNQQRDSLKLYLENQDPDYYKIKYDYSVASLGEVQQKLASNDHSLLHYVMGDSTIFMFLINEDAVEFIRLEQDTMISKWVNQLRKGLTARYVSDDPADAVYKKDRTFSANQYAEAAHNLYQKLIAPIAEKLKEKVIIIPDGVLNYLPFQTLLKERPEVAYRYKTHKYFGIEHQVSYTYSATLLKEMENKKHSKTASGSVLALAPFNQSQSNSPGTRSEFSYLKYSEEEINSIGKIWQGDLLKNIEATKENFINQCTNYRILHLSTHGEANDKKGESSYLVFKDSSLIDLLYTNEIYNLRLNADLVVLSACQTGIGELQKGEGMVSLARAFAYAGAKSILTTLWAVDDAKTKDLMIAYHQLLKEGKDKDTALWEAQKNYINNQTNTERANPFFWAPFIGIGDMGKVEGVKE